MDGTLIAATASTITDVTERPTTAAPARGITGVCLLFGTVGNSSAGRTRFLAGSLRLPADLSRVKLLFDHDPTDPIGYLTEADVTDASMTASFAVADGDKGDTALQQATDKRRDGLSVGCSIEDWEFDGDTVVIKAATLSEVSLVSLPAFTDARITEVRAHRKDEIVDRKILVTCSNPDTPDEAPTETTETETTTETTRTVTETPAPDAPRTVQAAAAPVYTKARAGSSLTALTAATVQHLKAGLPAASLTAALTDVVPAGHPNLGPNRPQYVDELWQASQVARPLIDAIGATRLTSLKLQGFKWKDIPKVEKYAGSKAAIPSGPITREPAEKTAQRFAGGWDIDRVFVDLPGGEDFLSEVFKLATDDYRLKSEAYVAETLLAEGTAVATAGTVTLPAILSTLGNTFAGLGAELSFVQMSPDRWTAFTSMKASDAPWWLQQLGNVNLGTQGGDAGGISFRVNNNLPANTVIGGDKRAVKIGEIDPPIKVQAIDLPRGGVDLGVFGYIAAMVMDPRSVIVMKPAA